MSMTSKALLGAAVVLLCAASPTCADPPDFAITLDLGPNNVVDLASGVHDPQGSATLNGTMSGSLDNGIGYWLAGDAIFERHADFPVLDTNYLKASGQLNYETSLGKVRFNASNLSVFDPDFEAMSYNLTDVSLGIDRGFDLTDDVRMKLALNVARRFELTKALDRYSVNPSVSFTTTLLGLDAYVSASYSYRDFVFRDRSEHYFGTGLTLSKTFNQATVGVSANLERVQSSIPAFSYTSFIVGPNFTLTLPIE